VSRDPGMTPLLLGLSMVALGLAASRIEPGALSLPAPARRRKRLSEVRTGRDAAKVARDGIARFIPDNLTASIGRTLVLMGTALVAVRLLDEIVEDEGVDY
jgi:hypothetical protein